MRRKANPGSVATALLALLAAFPVELRSAAGAVPPGPARPFSSAAAGGLTLAIRDGRLVVDEVAPDSAAAQAGVLAGDTILAIDDTNLVDLDPLSPAAALELFSRPRGRETRLILGRGAGTLQVALTREPAPGPPPAPPSPPKSSGGLRSGMMAPLFTGRDVQGREVALRALRGRPVLVEFWASWCAPCRPETVVLRRLADQFAGRIEIVGVSLDDDREAYEAYVYNLHLPGRQIFDGGRGGPIGALYGLAGAGLPYSVLIDAQGRIVSLEQTLRVQEEAIARLAGRR